MSLETLLASIGMGGSAPARMPTGLTGYGGATTPMSDAFAAAGFQGNTDSLTTSPGFTMADFGGANGPANSGFGANLGWNVGTGQLAMAGMAGLSNLWSGFQSQKLAKDQFDFTKRTTAMNIEGQRKSYNNQLEDKYRTRGIAEGRQAEMDALYNRNRMTG